jgi:hypothetical protein
VGSLTITTIRARKAAPAITDDERAAALVIRDAVQVHDERIYSDSDIAAERHIVENAARREYLRLFPRCIDIKRAACTLFVQRIERFAVQEPASGTRPVARKEWQFYCLFCRASVATLGDESGRTLPIEWWRKIQLHCLGCAASLVIGTGLDARPFKAKRPPKSGWQPQSADAGVRRRRRSWR